MGMKCKKIPWWARFVDFVFKETKLMATFKEVLETAQALAQGVAAINAKLDEVKAFIESLSAPVNQEQLDELAALLGATKTETEAVLAEADALDETGGDEEPPVE